MAASVTPCFSANKIRACLYRAVCVILFIANRYACLSVWSQQLNLNTGSSYSLPFFPFLLHIIVNPTRKYGIAPFFLLHFFKKPAIIRSETHDGACAISFVWQLETSVYAVSALCSRDEGKRVMGEFIGA